MLLSLWISSSLRTFTLRLRWHTQELVNVCAVCHAPNLGGAVPSQRASSHLKGGFPAYRAAALFREALGLGRDTPPAR